jgi:hypothetical protein
MTRRQAISRIIARYDVREVLPGSASIWCTAGDECVPYGALQLKKAWPGAMLYAQFTRHDFCRYVELIEEMPGIRRTKNLSTKTVDTRLDNFLSSMSRQGIFALLNR